MREHLGFLKASSAVVKIAAWIFLLFGVTSGVYILFGRMAGKGILEGSIIICLYTLLFFVLYIIAKIADLLVKIINEIKKE